MLAFVLEAKAGSTGTRADLGSAVAHMRLARDALAGAGNAGWLPMAEEELARTKRMLLQATPTLIPNRAPE